MSNLSGEISHKAILNSTLGAPLSFGMGRHIFGCRNYKTRNQVTKPLLHPWEELYQQLDKLQDCSNL